MTRRASPYRLTPPTVPEHSVQRVVADVLRLEIAPAGKVSRHGVCWWSVDHANYAGEVPGIRIGRGIVAGIPDVFVLAHGRSHFVELKTEQGQLSDPQRAVCSAVIASGGRVGVACCADDVLRLIDAWGIPRAHRVKLQQRVAA